MRINKSFFKKKEKNTRKTLDDLLINGENYPPRPWEVADGLHPHIFTCHQGAEEFWYSYLWMPFWCALSTEQQEKLKQEAPDPVWIEWLELKSSFCDSFLQAEKQRKDHAQDLPERHYSYVVEPKYEPAGLWGIPLVVALTTVVSLFPATFLVFTASSPGLYFFTVVLQAVFVAICAKNSIKAFKMRSPQMACRLILFGYGLGCVVSLFIAAYSIPGQEPIELITRDLYNFFHRVGLFQSFRASFGCLVWFGMFICIVYFGALLQVYQPYSRAGGHWCRRLKLPHQRLPVNSNGLTPYRDHGTLHDPNEYDMIDGILLPKKSDPVWFFKFLSVPCLRIIIYFGEPTEHNYIHIILRKGLEGDLIAGRLRSISHDATKQILDRFSKPEKRIKTKSGAE